MIIEVIIYFAILATSYPVAKLLAWLCDDELLKDRKYFILFAYFLIVISIIFMIFYFNIATILSLVYLMLILFFLLGKDKKFKRNSKK